MRALVGAALLSAMLALPTSGLGEIPSAGSVQIGGIRGTQFVPHHSGDEWEYAEDVALRFQTTYGFDPGHHYTVDIVPSTPYVVQYPPRVERPRGGAPSVLDVVMRKRPGVAYTVTVSGIKEFGGRSLLPDDDTLRFTVHTRSDAVPDEPRAGTSRAGERFYCALEHAGGPPGLGGGAAADRVVLDRLTDAGVSCVRYGISANAVARDRDRYAWDAQARLLDELSAAHIEPSIAIDAQDVPAWASGGVSQASGFAAFQTPALYGEFVTHVVAYLHARYPKIARYECGTNEPNDPQNFVNATWRSHYPQYDNHDGAGLAPFLRACYDAVHAQQPDAVVSAPGAEIGGRAFPYLAFLDGLESHGCRYKRCWDVLSLHEYPQSDADWTDEPRILDNLYGPGTGVSYPFAYRTFQREAMRDEGHAADDPVQYPVAITETGIWGSHTANAGGLDDRVQALVTAKFFNALAADRSLRWIVWSDVASFGDDPFDTAELYDTLGGDGARKPVWSIFHRFATH